MDVLKESEKAGQGSRCRELESRELEPGLFAKRDANVGGFRSFRDLHRWDEDEYSVSKGMPNDESSTSRDGGWMATWW